MTETAAKETIFFRSFVLIYSKLGLTFQGLVVQASSSSIRPPGFFLEIGEAWAGNEVEFTVHFVEILFVQETNEHSSPSSVVN